jgi:3-oxoacyl-[acyl-carrier protein] reductase
LGPIDILVANAGGSFTRPGPLEETSEEGVACVAPRQPHRHILDHQEYSAQHEGTEGRQHHHHLVSGKPPTAPRLSVPYAAAKAGIEILAQDLAAQVGPYGIRVNSIAPETILTERNEERIPDAQKQMLRDLHPIRRLGTPEDVAYAALFLASDNAAWITGIVLDVVGGAVMV